MTWPAKHYVPKVHPASRPVEAEDPYSLHATAVGGDPEVMLDCLVQEYAWMGWGLDQILGLFRDPFYPTLHALWRSRGEDWARTRAAEVLRRMGVFHVKGEVHDDPEPAEEEPPLIELGFPASWKGASPPVKPEGSNHAIGH